MQKEFNTHVNSVNNQNLKHTREEAHENYTYTVSKINKRGRDGKLTTN